MRVHLSIRPGAGLVAVLLATLGLPSAAQAVPRTVLPNLVALQPTQIQVGPADAGSTYAFALRFSTVMANRGPAPFDLIAQPSDATNTGDQQGLAYQCVAWASVSRVCLERELVGAIEWDPVHSHYHLDDVARYELRRPNPDGLEPDMSPSALVAGGTKTTFCMEDTDVDAQSSSVGNAAPFYKLCDEAVQGISPGWSDTYGFGLEGQQISLNGVADGSYFLVVRLNPNGRFEETAVEDDTTATKIVLSDAGRRVTTF